MICPACKKENMHSAMRFVCLNCGLFDETIVRGKSHVRRYWNRVRRSRTMRPSSYNRNRKKHGRQ